MAPWRFIPFLALCLGVSCGGVGGWFGKPLGVEFSPEGLSFQADEGGADPASQTVSMDVTPDGEAWTAPPSEPWLSVSPASGNGDSTLTVTVSVVGLTEGDYTAQLIVDCPGTGGGPYSLGVALTVNPAGVTQDYAVVELTTGAVTYHDTISDLLTNDEYKTTKLVLKRIPAGTFQMGDETGDGAPANEHPVHTVNITKAFYLGVFEMTQKQWFEVQGDWPSFHTTNPEKRPVESVSWDDCQLFLAQVSTETGETLRLPTEAEWEYACKAGTHTNYSYGDTANGAYMWYSANSDTGSGQETHEVGTKLPSPWGFYDVHGNVYEMCSDWFQSTYYSSSPADDPPGPLTGTDRVGRGGTWNNAMVNCFSAFRASTAPTISAVSLGFRAAMTAPTGPTTGVWYVKVGGTGDGTSWANAFGHPQDAVDAASAGEEVWVAEGTYVRRTGSDTVLLTMKDGVLIYGGFAGTETARDDRDPAAHVTTLDGEMLVWHVVTGANNAALDGLTITRGNANGAYPDNRGAGMYNVSLTELTVASCTFVNNVATRQGGGMENFSSSPKIMNCIFSANTASATHGGGMVNTTFSSTTIMNCTFSGNSAGQDGGAICNWSTSSPTVTNCILWGNTAPIAGPEINNEAGTSCAVSYSDIEGCGGSGGGWNSSVGTDDGGNVDADPLFVGGGDYHLQAGSPCIDTGTILGAPETDIEGVIRPSGGGVDMGAYERAANNIWYVDATRPDDTGAGNSWAAAKKTIQAANALAGAGDEIWVADGTYTNNGGGTATVLVMTDGVGYYGGFQGTETVPSDRDPGTYVTTLDGNNEAYHVATGANMATLDGFTLTRGKANGSNPLDHGAGMFNDSVTSLTVAQCTFSDNTSVSNGAGMCNFSSSPTVIDCTFSANNSWNGGGIYNQTYSSPIIANCMFSSNTASDLGGGINNYNYSSPTVTNCVFRANTANASVSDGGGGGFNSYNYCIPLLVNCTFYDNVSVGSGDGLRSGGPGCDSTVTNCIFWGAASQDIYLETAGACTVSYSDVMGGYAGATNIDADPLFVDAVGGDLRLKAGSPCIDAADGDAAPATDIEGNARRDDVGTTDTGTGAFTYADMGAFEFQGTTVPMISVTSPAAGDVWDVGTVHNITWTWEGSFSDVKIEVLRNGVWRTIASSTPNTGTYAWVVTDPGYRDCLVRVSDASDGTPSDSSASFFKVRRGWLSDWPRGGPDGSGRQTEGSTVVNSGSLSFAWEVTGTILSSLIGDVDGDGSRELVVSKSGVVEVYSGNGTLENSFAVSGASVSALLDADGDGVLDIGMAGGYSGGTIVARVYDGNGALLKSFVYSGGGSDSGIQPMMTIRPGKILCNLFSGFALSPRGLGLYDYASAVSEWASLFGAYGGVSSVVDVDGDGKKEVSWKTTTSHNGATAGGTDDGNLWVIVVQEDGSNEFTPRKLEDINQDSDATFVFADLDANGIPEFYCYESHYSAYPGTCQLHSVSPVTGQVLGTISGETNVSGNMICGDTDGDGKVELVWIQDDGLLRIVDEGFTVADSANVGAAYLRFCSDITGDGFEDMGVTDQDTFKLVSGDTLSILSTYTMSASISHAMACDLDEDGRVETIVQESNGRIVVLKP